MSCLCPKCTVKNCDKKKKLQHRLTGKRNRNSGRYAELKLLKLFEKWGIEVHRTIASGQLKSIADIIDTQKELFISDFYSDDIVKGQTIRIENKKRQYKVFKKYYEKCDKTILYIKEFCYIMTQDTFTNILTSNNWSLDFTVLDDTGNKALHDFFEQDNADIVTIISPDDNSNRYLDFLFCIKENIFKKMIGAI